MSLFNQLYVIDLSRHNPQLVPKMPNDQGVKATVSDVIGVHVVDTTTIFGGWLGLDIIGFRSRSL